MSPRRELLVILLVLAGYLAWFVYCLSIAMGGRP